MSGEHSHKGDKKGRGRRSEERSCDSTLGIHRHCYHQHWLLQINKEQLGRGDWDRVGYVFRIHHEYRKDPR